MSNIQMPLLPYNIMNATAKAKAPTGPTTALTPAPPVNCVGEEAVVAVDCISVLVVVVLVELPEPFVCIDFPVAVESVAPPVDSVAAFAFVFDVVADPVSALASSDVEVPESVDAEPAALASSYKTLAAKPRLRFLMPASASGTARPTMAGGSRSRRAGSSAMTPSTRQVRTIWWLNFMVVEQK
jgi:hypothetical protein